MFEATDYRITVQRRDTEDGRLFEGTVREFPDVSVYGETFEEAYELVVDAIEALQELLADQGRPIPAPTEPEQEYSGKFIVRAPKWVHRDLVHTAAEQGVSLNQYIVSVLSAHTVVTKPASYLDIQMAILPERELVKWQSSSTLAAINSVARNFSEVDDDCVEGAGQVLPAYQATSWKRA